MIIHFIAANPHAAALQISTQSTLLRFLIPSAAMMLIGLRRIWPWRRKNQALDSDNQALASLSAMSETIAAISADPSELAEIAYQETTRMLDTDFFQLGLLEGDGLRMLIQVRDGKRLEARSYALQPKDKGIIGWVRDRGFR